MEAIQEIGTLLKQCDVSAMAGLTASNKKVLSSECLKT